MKNKIVYFENPENPDRVAYTITEQPIKELVRIGVLKVKQPHLSYDYDPEDESFENFLMLHHTEYLKFDNKKKPTKLVINSEFAAADHVRVLKEYRVNLLDFLDKQQIRYMGQGKDEVVKEIEKDKQVLRDMPKTLKIPRIESISKLYNLIPAVLLLDYEDKYKRM